jgi:hypothetical protein
MLPDEWCMGKSVGFLDLVSEECRWSLLKFVVGVFIKNSVVPMTTLW